MPPKQGTMQRRAGLARDNRVRPLLSQVNGQRRALVTDDRPVDRPPDDSDDEITDPEPRSISSRAVSSSREASRVFSSTKPVSDSDDDESARSSRADIRPYFGSSKRGKEQSKTWSASQESSQGQAQYEGSQGSFSTTRGSKRNSPDGGALSPESQMRKVRKIDLEDEKEAKRLLVRKKSYGRGDGNRVRIRPPARSKSKSSQERPISKLGKEASAPKMIQPSFKAYDDDPFEQFSSRAPPKRIIDPVSTFLSSPPHASAHPVMKHASLSPHSSPKRKAKADFKLPSASLPESLQSPAQSRPQLRSIESSPEPDSKKTRKFSFESSSDLSDLDSGLKQVVDARCPMCNEIVDDTLLHDFSKGARLHIRKQIQFCRLHKKKSAEEAWGARGYPKIDWDVLDTRIASHYNFLRKIINGGSSHFGDLLLDKVREGKNRTLLKAEDSLTPGYYGPRGLRAFSEHIIGRFSSVLRERAVDDRLISSRGYSSYVEAVLVPELAVLLISDDMVVEAEEARSILEDSKWIGDLLHEDTGDTVDQMSDDERTAH
ncbi:RTC4-like domain-containing protein [Colletotrichum godetiae]|uniref:Restriction of telomere capping protein 4 n=1 Tax=Colletotrichum godetiae TaxID=1209918 RepID=A0AAJ0AV50_9PEZI|nr:RTC4-like domain-containing protein [Colletotrichum godetiae]KAK1690952.1 RTC4-like domain-containing protein [Colletotrichum godetiae]